MTFGDAHDDITVTQLAGTGSSCTCEDLKLTGNTVDSTAGSKLIGTYSTTCVTGLSASSSAAWISSLTIGSGTIGATLTQNTGGSARSATVTVNGTTTGGTACQRTFTVTQSSQSICSCDNLTVAAVSSIASSGGSSIKIGSYTGSCLTNITASASDSWISNITVSNGNVYGTVAANTSSTGRGATIVVSGYADGSSCSKPFTLTQDGSTPIPTGCNVSLTPFTGDYGADKITGKGSSRWQLMFMYLTGDCYSYSAFTCTSGDDFLTYGSYNTSTKIVEVVAAANPTTSSRTSVYRMTFGDAHADITVTQLPGTGGS